MFVCPQISTVKHLWVDLHDEVDRFVFWQYICHPRFPCQGVRCALGVIRWLISVLWDVLPCLLCFKWQKSFFLALAAGIHIPSAIVCVFLLSEDWILSTWTGRMSLDTAPCRGRAQSFHTHPDPSEGGSAPVASSLQGLEYIFRHSQPHYTLHHPCVKNAH